MQSLDVVEELGKCRAIRPLGLLGPLSEMPLPQWRLSTHCRHSRTPADLKNGSGRSYRHYWAFPEPAPWAMMLLRFGAVGFSARRRRLMELVRAA